MKKLTTRWYYSLEDIAYQYVNDPDTEFPLDIAPTDGFAAFCCTIADEEGYLSGDSSWWSGLDTTAAKKMWYQYLWPEFKDVPVGYLDVQHAPWEEPADPTHDEVFKGVTKGLLPKFMRWLAESGERFSVLIDAYETIENTLLSRVTTVTSTEGESEQGSVYNAEDSSLNLRNDTPQEGGDFTADPYVNEATKHTGSSTNSNTINNSITSTSTVATDLNTPIERLNEIREKLHNLYADWANEFARFVIYSAE